MFGLGSMAPAVYAANLIGWRFRSAWPVLSRTGWTLAGAAASFPIVALGWPMRTGTMFGALGAAFAPVVGALAADYVRQKGLWPGPRRGVNLAGCLAWAIGLVVGLMPLVGPPLGWCAIGGVPAVGRVCLPRRVRGVSRRSRQSGWNRALRAERRREGRPRGGAWSRGRPWATIVRTLTPTGPEGEHRDGDGGRDHKAPSGWRSRRRASDSQWRRPP